MLDSTCKWQEMHATQITMRCPTPVHVFCRKVQQSDHDTAPKLGIEFGLIIDDVHKAFCKVELHMKVGKIGGNTAPQAL